jgi:molybdopterin-guanine dinucleotide biosynthesis protein A
MGRDKALIEVGGEALAIRVAAALTGAGLAPVSCVGGDLVALRSCGLVAVADDHPGEGPLGGVLTALSRHRAVGGVVVAACDLVAPSVGAVTRLLVVGDAVPDAGVVLPVVAGRRQWLHALWRPAAAPALAAAFAAGERSVARAAEAALTVHAYAEADPLADADLPRDLPAGAG